MATRGLQNGLQGNQGSPAQRRGHGRGCGAACAGLAEPGGRPPSLGDTDYTTSCEVTPIWAWSWRPRRHDMVPYWQGGGAGMAGTGGREGRPSCQLAAWPKSQAGVSKRLRVKKQPTVSWLFDAGRGVCAEVGVTDAGKSADRSSEKMVVWWPEKDQVLPPGYLALSVMFSYRTCAGILLFSKSTSGPNGGQANFPNHAGFSFK